jgi:ABC-2 type transport system permease protein
VICLGLVLLGAFFFFPSGSFWQNDRSTLTQIFFLAPRGLSLVVIPVLTMRLLAEEKRSGTLEMLITLPVKDHEVILGKFLGAWGLVLILILATGLFPLMMFKFPWHLGALDAGPVISGYLGLIFYSAAAVALGLLISALTESQVIAFFITWILLVLLSFMGMLVEGGSASTFHDVIAFISFDSRLAPFARGKIVTSDIVYFLSVTVGSLMAAFRALERRKWA